MAKPSIDADFEVIAPGLGEYRAIGCVIRSFIRRRIGVGPYFSGPGCWLILEIGRVDCRPILYFCNDCISVATTVPLPSGRHLMDEVVKVDGGLVVCDFRCCGVVQKPDVGEIVVAGRAYPFVSAEEPDGE